MAGAQFLGSEDPQLGLEQLVGPYTVKLDRGNGLERRRAEVRILETLDRHMLEQVQVQGIEGRASRVARYQLELSMIEVESAASMDKGMAPVGESSNLEAC